MRKNLGTMLLATAAILTAMACGSKKDPNAAENANAANQGAYGQPGQYPQQGQPGYGGQPGAYPQQGQPGYGQTPTTQPPAQPGQMAVPSPLAFPCQNDGPCGFHKCNTQYGKCAFPCASDVDCATNTHCFSGVCLMSPPSAAPAPTK